MRTAPSHQLPANLRARASAVAISLLLMGSLPACGTKHEAKPSTVTAASTTSTTAAAPTTTQPPSTDPAVKPILNDLLHQWDRLMTIADRDPHGWINNPDPAGLAILRTSFSATSVFAEQFDDLIRALAEREVRSGAPADGAVLRSALVNISTTPDADHAEFVWCTYDPTLTVSTTTNTVLDDHVLIVYGTGTATRENGTWVLNRLTRLTSAPHPAGSPDRCPSATQPESTN